jgi:hypothetical protein
MTATGTGPMTERDIVDLVEHAAAEAQRIRSADDEVTWVLPLPSWTSPGERTVIETELRRRFPNWKVYTHLVGSIREFLDQPMEPGTMIGGTGPWDS